MTTTRTEPWYYSASLLPVGTPVPPQSAVNRHAVDFFQQAMAPLLPILWGVDCEPRVRFFQAHLTSLTYGDKVSFMIDTHLQTLPDGGRTLAPYCQQSQRIWLDVGVNAIQRCRNEPEPRLFHVEMIRLNPPQSKNWDFKVSLLSAEPEGFIYQGLEDHFRDSVRDAVSQILT